MRILTLTDLYPPHYIGGYELACHEVMSRLSVRGHTIRVVTSDYRRSQVASDEGPSEVEVLRVVPFLPSRECWDLSLRTLDRERKTRLGMGRLIREFRPDVISIWNLGNVSPAVLDAALASGLPLVYSIFDYWLMGYGDNHPWTKLWRYRPGSAWKRGTKRCLEYAVRSLVAETRSPSPRSHSAIYFSEFLKSAHREKGIIFAKSTVIYHGVDLSALHYTPAVRSRGTRLLYAGRLDPDKGVHVAIEALVILTQEFGRNDLTLDIVGESRSPEYADRLRRLADLPELTGRIRFLGWRSRSEVLALLTDYDVMLFPSIWPEPFGIVLIEAMAVGLPVVGTDRGGSVELLRDGKNGLVAAAANPSSMATQINRLMNDPSLRDLLRNEARRDVEIQCDLNVTVDKIEQYLAHTVCRVIPPTCETQLTTV